MVMKVSTIIVSVCTICFCGCATGSGELEHRISRLERLNSQLENKLVQTESLLQEQRDTNGNLMTATAELRATMDQLRANTQTISGRMEEMEFSARRENRVENDTENEATNRLNRVEVIARANDDRITALEQYLDFEVASVGGVVDTGKTDASTAPEVEPQHLSESELYAVGKKAFDDGQYEIAREKFLELLKTYPKSDNADNAQFWIGEIYFNEKWYTKAITEYQKVIENYPDGNKVPASLLKQGLAFFNLDEKVNARFFLQEVINNYPTSNEAKTARKKLKTF